MSATYGDEVRFTRPCFLPGVELVTVAYRNRVFPEHSHREWVFGAIVAGAETLVIDGTAHTVRAGEVLRLAPDHAHANSSIGAEILRYRVAYIPEGTLEPYRDAGIPVRRFVRPVISDAAVHASVTTAHQLLSSHRSKRLEQETAIAALAAYLFADQTLREAVQRPEQRAVAAARAYIDEHFADGFGLGALSDVARLSVFHLSRTFRQSVGLSPLAYRNQRRLVEAKRLLLAGRPIADVALAVGYADQSHLTRQFQRIVGVSPARYARG